MVKQYKEGRRPQRGKGPHNGLLLRGKNRKGPIRPKKNHRKGRDSDDSSAKTFEVAEGYGKVHCYKTKDACTDWNGGRKKKGGPFPLDQMKTSRVHDP